ncbi:hypothetical protein ACWD33_20620 [Streptomyces xiamenensis]|uniref:DNA-directed RNA polymerase specialized sigma24 family protein n=1 Tax=Streptomyces xiamenensis TaxID=408015 RepID=A0A0F7FSG2_9ACTN|nr:MULTISPECIES: hypothetical protein [Streptomyces]AKG42522.1 hypothetical protein SXIM_11380 [Streptomyces xiamenensis]
MSSSDLSSPDVKTTSHRRRETAPGVGPEQAAAALVEHYPRLVRLAYLALPDDLGRHRRVLTAHALVQRAVPRGRTAAPAVLPTAGGDPGAVPVPRAGAGPTADPGYLHLRQRVLRAALTAARPVRLAGRELPRLRTGPYGLPRVAGLRLFPRATGDTPELALEQALKRLTGAGRAAYALRRLDGLNAPAIRTLLAASGVDEDGIRAALRGADTLPEGGELVDPCALTARPTDLARRRRRQRTFLAGAAALALAAGTVALVPGGWGPDGAAAPPYAENAQAQAALDPKTLRRMPADVWEGSSRVDFAVWPARGEAVNDQELLRRALAVWARPGESVGVSATPGTQTGPPPGPPQLLFAGEVGQATVVLLYDGMRLVRYAEAAGATEGGAVMDFARVDGADALASSAVVLDRADGNTRYLLAPWVESLEMTDLLTPGRGGVPAEVDEHGVSAPVRTPAGSGTQEQCAEYAVLEFTAAGTAAPYAMADLGELTPALLTYGAPGERAGALSDGTAAARWARTACHLSGATATGVRSVNTWNFAEQELPDGAGTAQWVCTRAETWRGSGSRTMAQFQIPSANDGEPGAVVARQEEGTACGEFEPRVLAGVLWKSPADSWYLLAAGSPEVHSIAAEGEVEGHVTGRVMALPAPGQEADAELTATLEHGETLSSLG